MSRTVNCLANTEAQAESIIQHLNEISIPPSDVSVLFPDKTGSRDFAQEHNTKAPEGTANGAILISAHATNGDVVDRVKKIMKEAGAEDITSTGEVSVSDDERMPDDGRPNVKGVAGAIDPTSETAYCRDNIKGWPYSGKTTSFPMNLFKKLPGFAPSPPGLERKVLRLLPRILMLGTLFLCVPSLLARLYPWDGNETLVAMRINSIDIYMISAVILHWSIVSIVAIAAFIVMVMKGPAYVQIS